MDFANLPYPRATWTTGRAWPNPHGFGTPARGSARVPAPGQLYAVDGLSLHLRRSGPAPSRNGPPTIVIESGAGTASPVYARLQKALAAKYPVCSYDRPGLGWSQPDTRPLDARRNAHRLHALLAAAGVTGPILLIGHSLGGPLSRVYTQEYPEQVVALLMLDASHADQFALMGDATQRPFAAEREKRAKYRDGGAPLPPEMALVEAVFADMPDVLRQMVANYTPETIDTMVKEHVGLPHVARQAGASPDLGARPLSVLSATVMQQLPPGAEEGAAVQRRWPEYQEAHAALSTRSRLHRVEGAEHMTLVLLPPFVSRVAEEVDWTVAELGRLQ
jgi:pimeloyl-ACP methyl ester carboxylesterase